jgi:transcriptional regulator with XRE-family HTH domain
MTDTALTVHAAPEAAELNMGRLFQDIEAVRLAAGLTDGQLAKILHTQPSKITGLRRGDQPPSANLLLRILVWLDPKSPILKYLAVPPAAVPVRETTAA